MGTMVGHVAPGFGFLLIGLWHLFNNIKLHTLNPTSFISPPWFPSSFLSQYLELYFIIFSSTASISMELFIGPDRHQPFDPDGTIPSNHLHNFEHSLISLTFLLYASFSILLHKSNLPTKHPLTQLLASIAFSQQLLLFHLHSADHNGPEGQYHTLLQILIFLSLSTTLLQIPFPSSFLLSFFRSLSIFFQGFWLIVMGLMLWTPSLVPKGCFINLEEGHQVVRCHSHPSLHRAISLVNILFSSFVVLITSFAVSFYLLLFRFYSHKAQYSALGTLDDPNHYVESQKRNALPLSLVHAAKTFDIER